MKTGFTLLFVLIILIILLSVDFHFGRKKHLSGVKKTYFPSRRSDLHLFTKGEELTEQLFHDIQKAKRFVHVQFFIIKNDHISQRFTNLLKKKAEEGIEVRLIVDWIGSFTLSASTRKKLENSGVKFSYSLIPKWPYLFYTLQKRNHRKLSIIDGEIGYIGGFNIAKEYINGDKKLSPWRDYHLRISGEGVQDLESVFLSDWLESTGEEVNYQEVYVKSGYKGSFLHQITPSKGAFLEDEYIKLIQEAKESITIAAPYFIPSTNIMRELLASLARGISLIIIVPALSDHFLVKEAAYPYLRQLISAGAKVYQFQKGFFHGKYILIDKRILDIGTANFDKRSFFLNYEINCYIYDKEFIEIVQQEINKDIENSQLLALKDLQKLGLWNSVKEYMGTCIDFFL